MFYMEQKRALNIFGKKFPVIRADILTTQGNLGFFDLNNIILDVSLEGEELVGTEIHELIHAVAERTGLTVTSIHADVWEVICENISRALIENYDIKPKEVA